jgi:uncharacterized protein YbjT (DUF2867 family)
MLSAEGRTVLVSGATGKQGMAVIAALKASTHPWRIKALTRNTNSKTAQSLIAEHIMPVAGDMSDPPSLQKAMVGVDSVFSVQANFAKDADGLEVRYGKNMVDAAVASGIRHFVYASVGGAERLSGVPHFESKRQIEQHLEASKLNYTIIRPASFMDNFESTPVRTVLLSLFKTILSPDRKLQLVATRDIGAFVVLALEDREAYAGKAVELAGDEVTVTEMIATLRRSRHKPVIAFKLPTFIVRQLPEDFPRMVGWFEKHGFKSDIQGLRAQHPSLLSLADWAKQD